MKDNREKGKSIAIVHVFVFFLLYSYDIQKFISYVAVKGLSFHGKFI